MRLGVKYELGREQMILTWFLEAHRACPFLKNSLQVDWTKDGCWQLPFVNGSQRGGLASVRSTWVAQGVSYPSAFSGDCHCVWNNTYFVSLVNTLGLLNYFVRSCPWSDLLQAGEREHWGILWRAILWRAMELPVERISRDCGKPDVWLLVKTVEVVLAAEVVVTRRRLLADTWRADWLSIGHLFSSSRILTLTSQRE